MFWRDDARGCLGSESRTRLCLRPADGQRLDSFCFFSRVFSRNVRSLLVFLSRRLRMALPRARFFRVPLSLSRHSAPPFSAFGTGTSLGIAVGASSQPWGARPRVRGLRTAGQRAERSGAREAPCRLGARVRGEDFREGRHARSTAASRTPRAPSHTTRGCTYRTPSRTSSTPRCSRAYRASRRRGNRTPRDTECVEGRETGATVRRLAA